MSRKAFDNGRMFSCFRLWL